MDKNARSAEIGNRLRKAREACGMSMKQAAHELKISYSAICQYEYGCRQPADTMKIRLSNLYGVPVQEIFFPEQYDENE